MKNKKSFMPFLLLAILGMVVTVGMYTILNANKVEVLVASGDIDARTEVTDSMVTTKVVPEDLLPQGAMTVDQKSEIVGKVTNTKIVSGTPISNKQFLSEGDTSVLTSQVPDKDKVLMTVPVTAITGVSAKLSPLEKVNVYSAYKLESIGVGAKLILQNIQVVATSVDANSVLNGVTLAVTPEQAESLVFATSVGEIQLAVVPYDYEVQITNGLTEDQFRSQYINNGASIPQPTK